MKNDLFLIKISIILFIAFVSLLIIYSRPTITLKGNKEISLNLNEEYKEEGYIASFLFKNYTKKVKTNNNIDNTKIGSYKVVYDLTIANYKIKTERIVKIVDKEKPTIELLGNNNACPNKEYEEEGYKAIDNYDGDITDKVVVSKEKDKIKYEVSDQSNNSTQVTREITYVDNDAPSIELINGDITLYVGTNYNEPGYNATDNCDTEVNVQVSNNININSAGTYQVVYKATDSAGNVSEKTRTVKMINPNLDGAGKVVYLTFDDGPGYYTKSILDTLAKYNVKATFFVTNQFPDYLYLIGEEYKQGHKIAVHTYSHNYDIYYSLDSYVADFNKMNEIVKNYTGSYSKLFRFPGGSSNTVSRSRKLGVVTEIANYMTNNGYVYFDWNVSSGDAGSYATSDSIYAAVTSGVNYCSSCVVLMHDIKGTTAAALDSMLANLINRGYTFATLNENSPTAHHPIAN